MIGFAFSFLQPLGKSPDYPNYEDFLNLAKRVKWDILGASRFEPGFSYVAVFFSFFFNSNILIYSAIVSFALWLKACVVRSISLDGVVFFIVMLFYFFRYFPLHELTQLRAACATSIYLIGFLYFIKCRPGRAVVVMSLAALFHLSSIAALPGVLFSGFKKRTYIIISAVCVFFLVRVCSSFLANYLSAFIMMLDEYQKNGFGDSRPNLLAPHLVIDLFFVCLSCMCWKNLSSIMRRVVVIEIFGLAIFYGGVEFAVIAHRLREFYSIFWIFFVAEGLKYKKTRVLSILFVFVNVFFYGYLYYLSGTFFS